MQFDVFHSIGRIDTIEPRLSDRKVYEQFFDQVKFAEKLGFDTVWMAESHFSSEVQKSHENPVIPNYHGEVGLNSDSMQLIQRLCSMTERLNFGTAILNIVGGNGGPLAAANRVRSLGFFNQFLEQPRRLHVGVAQGRFPYINAPFGIVPRNELEQILWASTKKMIFLEALEIFLRMVKGETLASQDLNKQQYTEEQVGNSEIWNMALDLAENSGASSLDYQSRWNFEPLKMVPQLTQKSLDRLRIVLGSHDPVARNLAMKHLPVDIFNLSFTPTASVNKVHDQMYEDCRNSAEPWRRWRMPRTVLVFIDENRKKAYEQASACFDTYIEAMRGTVVLPPKEVLMERAVIGDVHEARELMAQDGPLGFEQDDRLMLWFEFNLSDGDAIKNKMKLFIDGVAGHL
jgi:alkanesulfonate monooxygenase SsuD/methylene tetrahydromethanopterin reductase-like flavin-dependent oxidoreductase (luciferase family)